MANASARTCAFSCSDVFEDGGPSIGTPTPATDDNADAQPATPQLARDGTLRWVVAAVLIHVMAFFFAYFAPLMYGTPLSQADLNKRFWLKGWQ